MKSRFIILTFIFLSWTASANPLQQGFNMLLARRALTSYTQTATIATNADDGEIWLTDLWVSGEYGDGRSTFGVWNGDPVYIYLRFTIPTAIPSGSVITSALLNLKGVFSSETWDPANDYMKIKADDSANALQVTQASDRPDGATGRAATSAVRWPASGGLNWQIGMNTSPDIKSIVQTLVNTHGGLAAGTHLQLWVYSDRPGVQDEIAMAESSHASTATQLVINWDK